MTIEIDELTAQLENEFNIKLLCDLGRVSAGPNLLIKCLHKVYQAQYDVRDRIIFYTSYVPSEDLLQHLYNTTNFLDISNWFILICGPKDLESKIISSCQKFSHDPVPFQFRETELGPTDPLKGDFSLPETICAIPWMNLEIRSNGDITPCCMSTNQSTLGNIKDTTLDQAFHSQAMKDLRKSLVDGLKPSVCQNCWKIEEKNLTSTRLHNIKRFKKDFLTKYFDRPEISSLDIKFNNVCNFKCRICGPESSSLFAQEEHKFLNKKLIVQDNWGESREFTNQVAMHLPNIKNIDMYGGEPFLVKKFKEVLKLAVDQGYASGIRLHYNSNGSIWPKEFLPYWSKFKLVDIHFSIDAIGEQFNLQRGGKWAEVEKNILDLKNLGLTNLSISIMPTISIMNVYYIDQVYDWATGHGFPIFVNHVRGPGLELKNLTREAKRLILEKFRDHPWAEMQKILQTIQKLPDSDGKEFCDRIKWFDQVRDDDFSKDHLAIAKAMNYV